MFSFRIERKSLYTNKISHVFENIPPLFKDLYVDRMARQGCRLMRLEDFAIESRNGPLRVYAAVAGPFAPSFPFLVTFHLKLITLIYGTVNLGAAAAR